MHGPIIEMAIRQQQLEKVAGMHEQLGTCELTIIWDAKVVLLAVECVKQGVQPCSDVPSPLQALQIIGQHLMCALDSIIWQQPSCFVQLSQSKQHHTL